MVKQTKIIGNLYKRCNAAAQILFINLHPIVLHTKDKCPLFADFYRKIPSPFLLNYVYILSNLCMFIHFSLFYAFKRCKPCRWTQNRTTSTFQQNKKSCLPKMHLLHFSQTALFLLLKILCY